MLINKTKKCPKKICLYCGKVFSKKLNCSVKDWYKTKFCSVSCANLFKKGKSLKHNKQFQKGHKPWNKGLTREIELSARKSSERMMGQDNPMKRKEIQEKVSNALKDEKSPRWRGDNVGYSGLHCWVYKHKGRPTQCEHCGKNILISRRIHWANKSGNYLRDLNDWLRLCSKCHKEYDKQLTKGHIYAF